MRYSGRLHRRVVHLERVQQPSTGGKLQDVQHAALAMMSCEDRKFLDQLKGPLADDGRTSLEHAVAMDRFNEAFVVALVAAGPRFSIRRWISSSGPPRPGRKHLPITPLIAFGYVALINAAGLGQSYRVLPMVHCSWQSGQLITATRGQYHQIYCG